MFDMLVSSVNVQGASYDYGSTTISIAPGQIKVGEISKAPIILQIINNPRRVIF
jgi:hypothetical protein